MIIQKLGGNILRHHTPFCVNIPNLKRRILISLTLGNIFNSIALEYDI